MSGSKDEVMKGSTAMGQLVDGDKTFEQIGYERLVHQAVFTANALRNMARDANQYTALAQQLHGHADDLERAAGVLK